jgi:Sel1 repeat
VSFNLPSTHCVSLISDAGGLGCFEESFLLFFSSSLLLFFIGSISAQQPDDLTREKALIAKAQSGDVDSQMWLGVAYEQGQFARLISKKLSSGYPSPWNTAIRMRKSPLEVCTSSVVAYLRTISWRHEWYRNAAEHDPDLGGAGQGRNNLGLLYLEGNGVPKDIVQAYMWFKLDSPANINLLITKSRMTSDQIRIGDALVAKWKGRARGPANTSSEDPNRRLVIIGLLRSINTAEAGQKYGSKGSSYLPWSEQQRTVRATEISVHIPTTCFIGILPYQTSTIHSAN